MKMLGFSLAGGLGEAAWSRGLRVSSKDTMSYAADGEGCAALTVSTLLSTGLAADCTASMHWERGDFITKKPPRARVAYLVEYGWSRRRTRDSRDISMHVLQPQVAKLSVETGFGGSGHGPSPV